MIEMEESISSTNILRFTLEILFDPSMIEKNMESADRVDFFDTFHYLQYVFFAFNHYFFFHITTVFKTINSIPPKHENLNFIHFQLLHLNDVTSIIKLGIFS